LVLLDISLYKREGRNLDGLTFIETVKSKHPHTKICIVTGYSEFIGDYENSVDYVFKKIDNATRQVLNQEDFTKKISELIK
jgi:two-component SAPR family response regulator